MVCSRAAQAFTGRPGQSAQPQRALALSPPARAPVLTQARARAAIRDTAATGADVDKLEQATKGVKQFITHRVVCHSLTAQAPALYLEPRNAVFAHNRTSCLYADLWIDIVRSPSELCNLKAGRLLQFPQGHAKPHFFAFRPPVSPPDALPAALVSPVFARFLDDLRAAPADIGCDVGITETVARLCARMPCAFDTEAARKAELEPLLKRLLSCDAFSNPADSSGARPDAFVQMMFDPPNEDLRALLAVVEWKNEVGSADPYFQGQAYYWRFWNDDVTRKRSLLCTDACPALLLEIIGPMVRVCALATLRGNRVQCEPLTPFMHFFFMPGQPEYMLRLLTLATALRRAMETLEEHYRAAADRALPTVAHPRGVIDRNIAIALPYALRMAYPNAKFLCPGKLLYTAHDTHLDTVVCLKLVAGAYGAEVHRLWAEQALAPHLHSVQQLPGGWTLVKMEYLAPPEWLPATTWSRRFRSANDERSRAAVRAAATTALEHAHALRLQGTAATVHGDCRGVNTLVRCATTAAGEEATFEVRFVDFDWADVQGGTRTYGPLLSTEVRWPGGVRPGAQMAQAHDADWLARDSWPFN